MSHFLISFLAALKTDRTTPDGDWIINDRDCILRLSQTLLKPF